MLTYNNLKMLYTSDIYAYMDLYQNDIKEYLESLDIDPQPNEIEDAAYNFIEEDLNYLKELIINFDNENNTKILIAADLGLWYGRRKATKICDNLYSAVFNSGCLEDINIIYFEDDKNTLTLEAAHHDGNNKFKFYIYQNGRKKAIKFSDLVK